MNKKATYSKKLKAEKLNLRKELHKYSAHWPWFVFCVVLCLALGFFYLRYTTPIYRAKASIIIKNEPGDGTGSAIYADLALGGMGTNNFDHEVGILKSRRLMKDVVKSLNLHIQYFEEGKVRTVELYDDLPFSLQVLRLDEDQLRSLGSVSFEVTRSGETFKITESATGKVYRIEPGSALNLGFADLVFSYNTLRQVSSLSGPVIIRFTDIEKMASRYRNKINLSQMTKSSGLMELEITDPVKQKARDILDQLVLEYNRGTIEEKNLIAGNTANFINERLSIINGELDSVETGKEIFKEQNQLTDIQAQSQMYIQNANEYNKRRQEVGTQLELTNAMLEYMSSNSNSDLLPSNLGIVEAGVNQQISQYNGLVLERNRILNGSSEKNPVVIRLNSNIEQIKHNVVQSLQTLRSNLLIGKEDLERQASTIGSQIYAVPSKERQFRGIERQQNIKETLYLFLLQKREENSLSLAVTEPKAKIVDRAYYEGGAVTPNSRNIYLGTFFLGLFIPFSFIYAKELLDNKVRRRSDIESFSKEIPLLGMIPRVSVGQNEIIKKNDRSVLAESFRIMITNLQYLLVNTKNKTGGIILSVTSTTKGEGKTFTAVNLAVTLSNTGKKVLLLGADLRNPRLQDFQKGRNASIGLSDYLINDELVLIDLIDKSNFHPGLDILTSGTIPPNPYELLKQEKVGAMFAELEKIYDYIVVDTAPAMLVADTFLISNYSDVILYMVRAGYTEKELLEFPLDAKEEGKLSKLCFVLNDMKVSHLGYGTKYGYGYGEVKQGFWNQRRIAPGVLSH